MSAMKYQSHTIVVGSAMLALVGSAGAMSPQGGYQVPTNGENAVPWPTELGTPGDFKRVVTGQFPGGSMAGALALVGDKAVLLFEPAVHRDVTEIAASGVNDIAALAPASPGLPAGMILAKTNGLYLASLDLEEGEVTSNSIATGNFVDLDLVRSGPINSTGLHDIVGANGANVYVLLESGSGWSAGSSFQAPGTVYDMVVGVDWDDDDDGDIALLLDQSVQIRESDGDVIETQTGYASGGFLAHVPPVLENQVERLAWSAQLPSPSVHALLLLSYPGTRTSCGFFDAKPASLQSAIFVDGEERRVDLLTGRPADPEVRLYAQGTSSPPYTAAAATLPFDAGELALASDGPPAFSDITFDGIPDVIAGRGATDDFVIVPGFPARLQKELEPEETFSDPIALNDNDEVPWFGITVQLPEDFDEHSYLQAMLWYSMEVDTFDPGERLEAGAIQNWAFFVEGEEGEQIQIWLPLTVHDGQISIPQQTPIVGSACSFEEGFAVAVRLVNVSWTPTPVVTSAGSPLYGVFSKDLGTIITMAPEGTEIPWSNSCISQPGLPPGIGYVPLAALPPKRTNVAPSAPLIGDAEDVGLAPNLTE